MVSQTVVAHFAAISPNCTLSQRLVKDIHRFHAHKCKNVVLSGGLSLKLSTGFTLFKCFLKQWSLALQLTRVATNCCDVFLNISSGFTLASV